MGHQSRAQQECTRLTRHRLSIYRPQQGVYVRNACYTYLPYCIFCRRQLETVEMNLPLKYFLPVCKHNFGSPVPSGCNIFRQVRSILIWYGIKTPTQTKITDFKFAVRVHEEISRLEVPVYDSSRMDKLHPFESNQLSVRVSGNYRTSKNLVAEILDMLIRECLARTDDLMKIG